MLDIAGKEDSETKISRRICYLWGFFAIVVFLFYFIFSWGEVSFSRKKAGVVYPNEKTSSKEFQRSQEEAAEQAYKRGKEPTPEEIFRGPGK
jgi:hypothetical protein